MKWNLTLSALTAAFIIAGAGIAEACSGCGCQAKEKKADSGCASGICGVTDAAKLDKDCSACSADHDHKHPENLTTEQMQAAVESGKYIVLDARSGKYFNGELIPGAKQLAANSEKDAIEKVLPNKDAEIITYCSNTQCPASAMLAEKLIELGYTNVHEYPEGIAGWKAAGGAVDTAD